MGIEGFGSNTGRARGVLASFAIVANRNQASISAFATRYIAVYKNKNWEALAHGDALGTVTWRRKPRPRWAVVLKKSDGCIAAAATKPGEVGFDHCDGVGQKAPAVSLSILIV